MQSARKVLQEQIQYFYLVRRLSLYELKSTNKNNYLGMVWELLNPAIQIAIYWFVFGTLRGRDPVMVGDVEVKFFAWLLVGFIVWIFFYQATIQGSKSIYSRLRLLSKMNFPMSVIPGYVIFSKFYVHLFLLAITVIVLQGFGFFVNVYYIQLLYVTVATVCLIYAISLITSTLSTMIRDVHMFINSTLRMLMYLSGVLWPITILSKWPLLMDIMKLNPLYYLIEGYRYALFGSGWFITEEWGYTLYFWGVVLVLYLIGAALHVKFRRHFIDYL
nr:ABC transporter permease [Lentibacillus sp. JNUCC-1]